MTAITANTVVSMCYLVKSADGMVLEDAMNNPPVTYLHGGPHIMPALQQQLEGLQAGDKKLVHLAAAQERDALQFEVLITDVRPASQQERSSGYPMPVASPDCGPDCSC